MDIRHEIPIKSFSFAAYVCKIVDGRARYLNLRRDSLYLNDTWQMISGRIEHGEKALEAALREIEEETGLVPDRLYSTDALEQFYEINQHCINLVPVFVGFVEGDADVTLTSEHSEYRWLHAEEAERYLPLDQQRSMVRLIEDRFVSKTPNELLRIDISAAG